MLLQFTAENFRSICDEVELSMRVSEVVPRGDEGKSEAVIAHAGGDLEVLRCAAIYGANASGKSNLVEALRVARQLVVHGTSSKDARLGLQPFRLDAGRRAQPSRFECYALVDRQIYGYGFAATNTAILEESLTMMIDGEETEVFSRRDGHVRLSDVLVAEPEDPKFIEYVARGTPENQLFLHEAMFRNVESEPLTSVFGWFAEQLTIVQPSSTSRRLIELAEADAGFREFLPRITAWADTGIKGLTVNRKRIDNETVRRLEQYPTALHAFLFEGLVPTDDGGMEEVSLELRHGDDASHPAFPLEDESDGTRRLLDLAPMLYMASKRPTVLVVDELDRSLHTLLAQQLIEMFVASLPGTTQLVFTTHDTNLLDCRSLRPDCIWFTEKSPAGATSLFSLAEFPPEQLEVLSKDLEKGYLRGRFGAIPFLGDPVRLGWTVPSGLRSLRRPENDGHRFPAPTSI
jgi:AAA15 family ATPase/GTPase